METLFSARLRCSMSGEANTESVACFISHYLSPFPSLLLYQILPEDPRNVRYSCGPHQMTTYSTLRVILTCSSCLWAWGERGTAIPWECAQLRPSQPPGASAKTPRLHLPIPGFQLLAQSFWPRGTTRFSAISRRSSLGSGH